MNHRNRHRAKTLEYLEQARQAEAGVVTPTAQEIISRRAADQLLADLRVRARKQKKGKRWIAAQLRKKGYNALAESVEA